MALVDLDNDQISPVGDGYDSIVIVDNFKSKRGGASLNTAGFPKPWIRAGHVIIKQTASPFDLKPMPLNAGGTAYAALPAGHTYYGILINTVKTSKAHNAGIMFAGTVNPKVINPQAGYYDIAGILSAVQTAFRGIDNHIKFVGDND